MQLIKIQVDKIWSYQTLVFKNGKNTYRKQVYNDYIKEMYYKGINRLEKLESRSISLKLTFHCKTRTVGDLDNIAKPVMDTLEHYGVIENDRYVTELNLKKIFGSDNNYIEIEIKES